MTCVCLPLDTCLEFIQRIISPLVIYSGSDTSIHSFIHSFIRRLQAKENFKVKDAFESLIRKVVSKSPNAGRAEGSGGVFGAGRLDK